MVLKKIMEMLGKKDSAPGKSVSAPGAGTDSKALNDIESFVDYVVRILVDKPEAVETKIESGSGDLTIIRVFAEKADIGKIIGRSGKTITAIRTLACNAGMRAGVRLSVELAE